MKFVHCADIHLDSPLRGLDRYPGAPAEQLRSATRRAFEKLIELAITLQVAFVLIAGDLYDGDWQDFNTGLFFVEQMTRLAQRNIAVFLLKGNHDAESRMTRQLPLPPNVHVFGADHPATVRLDSLGVAIHGMSFARPAIDVDLAALYPSRVNGMLNIGMLHTCLTGREGHEPYAPTSIDTLLSKRYDYWALGHVHQREVVNRDPWIVFPGNLQGRHIRETGPKGCTVVSVENGLITEVSAHAIDVLRWAEVAVDCTDAADFDEVKERAERALRQAIEAADERPVAARVLLRGVCRAHQYMAAHVETVKNEMRAIGLACGYEALWIEKVKMQTRASIASEALVGRDDPFGDLVRLLRQVREDEAELTALGGAWHDLKKKLPPELAEGSRAVLAESPQRMRELLDDVERLLLPRLLDGVTP
jgi:DNA repair exonuclease SbcCD nuclease subunit